MEEVDSLLVPAHPGGPGPKAIKQWCVCVRACMRACVIPTDTRWKTPTLSGFWSWLTDWVVVLRPILETLLLGPLHKFMTNWLKEEGEWQTNRLLRSLPWAAAIWSLARENCSIRCRAASVSTRCSSSGITCFGIWLQKHTYPHTNIHAHKWTIQPTSDSTFTWGLKIAVHCDFWLFALYKYTYLFTHILKRPECEHWAVTESQSAKVKRYQKQF